MWKKDKLRETEVKWWLPRIGRGWKSWGDVAQRIQIPSYKIIKFGNWMYSLVQLLGCVRLFATAAHQASLSITNSQSLLKLMSITSVMPSNHLILCHPLLLQPSIFPSIKVFSNESVLRIRWLQDWSFSFSISPSNEYSGLISFRIDWLDLLAVQGTLKSLFQHHSSKASILWCSAFFIVQLSQPYMKVKVKSLSHVQLCDLMDYCKTPSCPAFHQLPELTQTHVHRVGDTIQPSHPLSSPSPPAFNLSQHQGLFKWVSSSHQVAKVLEFQFQHQSFQWIFRTDFL